MSVALVRARALSGIQAKLVTIEVHISNGLPSLQMVGLPATGVKEAKERVRSAITNSGFAFPVKRITVNLAPADLPKEGGRYDLAIALGILAASGQVDLQALESIECCAELALTGDLRAVSGILPISYAVQKARRQLFVAQDNAVEAGLVHEASVIAAASLTDMVLHLQGTHPISLFHTQSQRHHLSYPDMADVKGQQAAKRALVIAAAGGHSLLFKGPPGSGKTMLASRLPGLLPDLDDDSAMQVAMLYSISHQGFDASSFKRRPFRAPHHSASTPALVGGGSPPKPGEISLAHQGVLFLDELPEYSRMVLESLREPLEAGRVMISRAQYQYEFPANFQLIAAMNPCPCGYYGDLSSRCSCTREQVIRYQNKLSGPLLDRIDLHVDVPAISYRELLSDVPKDNPTTSMLRAKVLEAQQRQQQRQQCLNCALNNEQLKHVAVLDQSSQDIVLHAMEKLNISARYYHRLLRMARTIADLDASTVIEKDHLLEALSYARRQASMYSERV